ncbi:methylmalonyl-CoA mutase family protein [Ekhidna sp.]|uniref:methylmalonyl-CoA mutase family protein n=1 Tax=Ekhidna sp. TaxID=2608089 RepID=UPI003B5000E4
MKDLNLNIFPPTTKDQWVKLAEKQLKGANPDDQLRWKNGSNIELQGYYDDSDLESLSYLDDFFSNIPHHKWKLYEEVTVENAELANNQVLKALMGGCDGVILRLNDHEKLDVVLKDVDRSICDISIRSSSKIESSTLSGMMMMKDGNCIVEESTLNPIEQITQILLQKHKPFIYRLSNPDFFLEIATVRALRYHLDQVGRKNVHIHSHVPLHQSPEHQWFLNTTSGLASVLGGSHSIDFTTATGDPRISRNTGNLIREESGLEEYTDQCRGSFYIEVLTDKIINAVKQGMK